MPTRAASSTREGAATAAGRIGHFAAAGALQLLVTFVAAGCAATPVPQPAAQAAVPAVADLLRQADEAYQGGDPERARHLYSAVIDADPARSRAVFRLGQLAAPGSGEALRQFGRYAQLEPRDPWGRMALGDALAAAGDVGAALGQYEEARRLAANEPDVQAGTIRILRDAGRIDSLIETYAAFVARQPGSAAAWRDLGAARQRAGQHAEAAVAYAEAYALAPDSNALERVTGALAEAAPSMLAYGGAARDSDENRVERGGFELLLPAGNRARVGLRAERARVRDPASSGTADAYALLGNWRPSYAVRLEGAAGVVRLAPPAAAADNRALARLRLRWRESLDSPAAELRLVHEPLIATPLLLAQPVQLTEGRVSVDLPMTGTFVGRLAARSGQLSGATQDNRRTGGRAALVYRAKPTWEVLASVGTLSYAHPGSASYFAPRRVAASEIGSYFEINAFWPLTLAVDAGAGRQRVTRHGEAAGDWSGTLRLWASVAWDIRPGVQLALEVEHDNSQIAATAATLTANWRSTSAVLSLRFPLGARSAQELVQEARLRRR